MGHSAEKDAAIEHELRLRLQTADQMLHEAQRRVQDAEDALDAHYERVEARRVTPPAETEEGAGA